MSLRKLIPLARRAGHHVSPLSLDCGAHPAAIPTTDPTQVRLIDVGMVRDGPPPQYTVTSSQEAADCVAFIKYMDREAFCVIHLDTRCRMCSVQTVSIGTLNEALVHPREIFKAAILSNANSIVLAHNHRCGVLTPSRADDEVTRQMVKASKLLAITVLDHIIVGPTDAVYSYQRVGRLADLWTSAKETTPGD